VTSEDVANCLARKLIAKEKWARIGNSVPPLLMKAIAVRTRQVFPIERGK